MESPTPPEPSRPPLPRAAWAVVGGAFALTCLFFHRAVFSTRTFTGRDMLLVYAPLRRYWVERVSHGEFPGWYPYDGLGQSFPGLMLSAVFHPSQWLGLVFSTATALKLSVLLCTPLALLGTYALLRQYAVPRAGAFFAGLVFAFSGYLVSLTSSLAYLMSGATLPLALWAAVRFLRQATPGRAAIAALCLGGVLLAGDTWSYAFANAFVLLLALTEAGPRATLVRRGLVLVVLGAGSAAPQLAAGVAVFADGAPGASSVEDALRWSVDPLRLPEFLMGSFLVDSAVERAVPEQVVKGLLRTGGFATLWSESLFIGVPAFVLAVAGLGFIPWRRWAPFAAVWGAVLALALGPALPFYGLLYRVLPLWRPFRYPEKLVVHLTLGVALMAGFGWKALAQSRERQLLAARVAGGLACVLALLGLVELASGAMLDLFVLPRWPQAPEPTRELISQAFRAAAFLSAGIALGCALALPGFEQSRARTGALMALQLGASFAANGALPILGLDELLDTPPAFIEHVRAWADRTGTRVPRVASRIGHYRLPGFEGFEYQDSVALMSRATLTPDSPALWGVGTAEAYLPAASPRVQDLEDATPGLFTELLPLYGVRFSAYTEDAKAGPRPLPGPIAARDSVFELLLVEHPDARPHLYLARPHCVPDAKAALVLLRTASFRASGEAAVECGGTNLPGSTTPLQGGELRVEADAPEHLVAEVNAPEGAVLIINDAWQPGWSARIDDAPAPLLPANVAVRAVPLPSGSHRVELRYATPGVPAGLCLFALTWAALAVAQAAHHLRLLRKRGASAPAGS
jgi:hypothetical protein